MTTSPREVWWRACAIVDNDFDGEVVVNVRADALSIGEMALDSNKRTTHYPRRADAPSAPCPHLYVPIWVEEEREQERRAQKKAHADILAAKRKRESARRRALVEDFAANAYAQTGIKVPERVIAEGMEAVRAFYRPKDTGNTAAFWRGYYDSERRRSS